MFNVLIVDVEHRMLIPAHESSAKAYFLYLQIMLMQPEKLLQKYGMKGYRRTLICKESSNTGRIPHSTKEY
jgi:hypothetical protein